MPNVKCVVKGCKNNNYNGEVKKKYHKFPKDEALRQEWITTVKKEGQLSNNAVVCSDHFEHLDYKVQGEKKWLLEKTAVPSLNLGIHEGEITPPRKRTRTEGFVDQAKKIISSINNQEELPSCSSPAQRSQNLPLGSFVKPPEKKSAEKAMEQVKDIVARVNNQPTKISRAPESVISCISPENLLEVLAELKLSMVQIKDWIVVHRPWFDMSINNEPYVGLQFYFNVNTYSYIVRVWGRTHSKGEITKGKAELRGLCCNIFSMTCCPGYPTNAEGSSQPDDLQYVDYPFRRRVSGGCALLFGKIPGMKPSEGDICSMCSASLITEIDREREVEQDQDESQVPFDINTNENNYPNETVNSTHQIEPETPCQTNEHLWSHFIRNKTGEQAICRACGHILHCKVGSTEFLEKHLNNIHNVVLDEAKEESPEEIPEPDYEEVVKQEDIYNLIPEDNVVDAAEVLSPEDVENLFTDLGTNDDDVNRFKCIMCGHTSSRKDNMESHIKTKHFKIRGYKCSMCGFAATRTRYLQIHMKKAHGNIVTSSPGPKKVSKVSEFNSDHKDDDVVNHEPAMDNTYEGGSQEGETIYAAETRSERSENIYQCSKCHYESSLETTIKEHIKSKHQYACTVLIKSKVMMNHTCDECGKTFTKSQTLKDHVKYVHNKKEKDQVCSHCGKVFLRHEYLRRHVKKMHPGVKFPKYIHRNRDHPPAEDTMEAEDVSESDITESEKLSEIDLMEALSVCEPAQCEVCCALLESKSDLDDHMLNMHISDNPFLAICTESLSQGVATLINKEQ